MTLELLLRRTGGFASYLFIFIFFVLLGLVVGVVFLFSFALLACLLSAPLSAQTSGRSSMSLFPLGFCFFSPPLDHPRSVYFSS